MNALGQIHLPDHRHLRDANILRWRSEFQLINGDGQFQIGQALEKRCCRTQFLASSPNSETHRAATYSKQSRSPLVQDARQYIDAGRIQTRDCPCCHSRDEYRILSLWWRSSRRGRRTGRDRWHLRLLLFSVWVIGVSTKLYTRPLARKKGELTWPAMTVSSNAARRLFSADAVL